MKKVYRTDGSKHRAAMKLLPEIELLEHCRELVDRTVEEAGRIVVETLLQLSAQNLTGPHHQGKEGGGFVRHGSQEGAVYLGGKKVRLSRPRVRSAGQEAKIPAYEVLRTDAKARERVHRAVLSGVSTRKYKAIVEDSAAAVGASKSSVSRRFVAESEARLQELLDRSMPQDLLVILIDGFHPGQACLVAAIGIDGEGNKHVLGIVEGTTENSAVAGDLLRSLVDRGLDPARRLLFVIDGGKALRKAVREVMGDHHEIQRCRVHKLRNVEDRLPQSKRAYTRAAIRAAWKLPPAEGIPRMKKVAKELAVAHPDAAASLLEGLEDTFTVNRLGLPPLLVVSLASTNLIENANGAIRTAIGRIKRFESSQHALRWCGNALLEAEQNMRTLKGHKHLWMLKAALGVAVQEEVV